MELLSVEYGDFPDLFNGDHPEGGHSACLKIRLSVDPALIRDRQISTEIVEALWPVFPAVRRIRLVESHGDGEPDIIAHLTASLILDLQRDLCEWPAGRYFSCCPADAEYEYDLCVESVDERVGRFSAQLAIEVMRMLWLEERFDLRLIWVIDLVRCLHRQPRLRLGSRRVANLLGCSRHSAEWAIQELERYGYLSADEARRPRRPKGRRILIIDDSARIRDLLGRSLELLGYDVITAVDGEEGLILLDWARYAAIFVDLAMPYLDGTVFLQRARAQGVTCPIFVMSGYEYRWSEDEIQALGATAYILKPFSIAEIESLLKEHVR